MSGVHSFHPRGNNAHYTASSSGSPSTASSSEPSSIDALKHQLMDPRASVDAKRQAIAGLREAPVVLLASNPKQAAVVLRQSLDVMEDAFNAMGKTEEDRAHNQDIRKELLISMSRLASGMRNEKSLQALVVERLNFLADKIPAADTSMMQSAVNALIDVVLNAHESVTQDVLDKFQSMLSSQSADEALKELAQRRLGRMLRFGGAGIDPATQHSIKHFLESLNSSVVEEKESQALFATSSSVVPSTEVHAEEPENAAQQQKLLHKDLCDAVISDDLDGLERLLQQEGAKELIDVPDSSGHTLLYLAARNGNLEMVQLLLAKGDREIFMLLRYQDGSMLTSALDIEVVFNREFVKLLLQQPEIEAIINTPDHEGETPLCLAAARGDLELVQLMLEKGASASVGVETKYGNTVLTAAFSARPFNPELVKFLLQQPEIKAIINTPNRGGETPLHLAAARSNLELVQLLLANGAGDSLGVRERNGETVLTLALDRERVNPELAKFLLQQPGIEAIINTPDHEGYTPLHWAVYKNDLEIAKLLLEKGAGESLNTPTTDGETPLQLAAQRDNPAMIELLMTWGMY